MIAYQIDSICDFMEDLFPAFGAYAYPAVIQNKPTGDPNEWLSSFWQRKITVLENRLSEHGATFLAGT